MSYKDLPEPLVARINPVDARGYAVASGWRRLPGANGKVAVYDHAGSDLDQLIIPLDSAVPDYVRRMAEVVSSMAEREGRPAAEVLDDLLLPPSDVLRFRLDEPASRSGFLPLEQGINLLEGARKALLSAACSVIQPQPFHPRLGRTEADQLIRSSLMGQSERGSYTAVISCPLDPTPADQSIESRPMFRHIPLPDPEPMAIADRGSLPFVRRTTGLLMRSVARIASAFDQDDASPLFDAGAAGPPISANLCEALMAMQPEGEQSRLCLSATWSRSISPPPQDSPPSSVLLRKEAFPMIENLSIRLRPAREPQASRFVGMVDSLHGDPDERGEVRGEVQLLLFDQDGTTKARAVLGAADYHTALEVHGAAGYVSLKGVLIRGARIHRIDGVTDFQALKS